MEVFNGMQLKSGAKADGNRLGTLIQPIQFISRDKKDEQWTAWNIDWQEWQGLKQLRRNARRLMKNYKLAKGIIDRTDYIVEENNEYSDLIDNLTKEDSGALELKFYPIIPNVINTMVTEFAKRNTEITYKTTDDYSYNEMFEMKRQQIEDALVSDAEQKMQQKMQEMGVDPESDDFKQQMSPDNIKSLPEIQSFFTKKYQNIPEQWAEHQYAIDKERFHMEELEERGFRDSLITDREFWHFKMMEDDYEVELWNPVLTFYHKSPETRYISQGNAVGKIEMMTVSDVIDRYGYIMTEDQTKSLEAIYPVRSAGMAVQGFQNDGTYYDPTRSHEWNTNMPSLGWRQYASMWDNMQVGGDIVNWITSESEDYLDLGTSYLLRVTTAYWKSQRRVGHLTKIDENGVSTMDVVDETYKITDKPLYNNTLIKRKDKDNLVFGEHIDWIWINETWGGVKIGPNRPSFWGMPNSGGVTPMYLGINKNTISRLPFQFKGDSTVYGCKLPVEGAVFTDRNTRSTAMIDLMKPYQIGYNIVNNQIADILIDELGTVIMLDQNALPKHSLGEDWGKNNYAKAFVAMKNFQILPLDGTIANTENAIGNTHFQKLDMEQTNRLLSRIKLGEYFKQQAFEIIGVNQQRMGENLEQSTATGAKIAVNASFAQTEMYFIQHSDYLMPRVHQMRTDLAQYYQTKNPTNRLQYITNNEERKFFELNGTDLLLRDINVFAVTKASMRNVVDQLKQMAMSNPNTGASIYDLANIIKSDSLATIEQILKDSVEKADKAKKDEQEHEFNMQQEQIKAKQAEEQQKAEFLASENEKDRQSHILEAEIRAAGYMAMKDFNNNAQSDYVDYMDSLQKDKVYQSTMDLNQQKVDNQSRAHEDKMNIAREKIQAQRDASEKALEIARTNKNKYDVAAKKKAQDAKKKK